MSNVRPVPPMSPGGPPAPGGGAMPPGGATPPMPAGGDGEGIPGVDMNDPITVYFMSNLDDLEEPDIQALSGMTPQLAGALGKILPQLGPIWNLFSGGGAAAAVDQLQAADGAGGPSPGAAPPSPPTAAPSPGGPPRPRSGLTNF